VARYSRQGPQMCQQTARPGAPRAAAFLFAVAIIVELAIRLSGAE
jgi:hypothetical protein